VGIFLRADRYQRGEIRCANARGNWSDAADRRFKTEEDTRPNLNILEFEPDGEVWTKVTAQRAGTRLRRSAADGLNATEVAVARRRRCRAVGFAPCAAERRRARFEGTYAQHSSLNQMPRSERLADALRRRGRSVKAPFSLRAGFGKIMTPLRRKCPQTN